MTDMRAIQEATIVIIMQMKLCRNYNTKSALHTAAMHCVSKQMGIDVTCTCTWSYSTCMFVSLRLFSDSLSVYSVNISGCFCIVILHFLFVQHSARCAVSTLAV